jgi:hypothetical protein
MYMMRPALAVVDERNEHLLQRGLRDAVVRYGQISFGGLNGFEEIRELQRLVRTEQQKRENCKDGKCRGFKTHLRLLA